MPVDPRIAIHSKSISKILLTPEYKNAFNLCEIGPKWQAQALTAANVIIKNQSLYEDVEAAIGVPWFVVAAIHYRESGFDFDTCLHNGDPLSRPTTHVPAGRGPFGTWSDAAVDALKFDSLDIVKSWDIGTVFYELEAFNGFGYRMKHFADTTPEGASPYIYSGSQFYVSGKYTDDGVFDSSAVDDQLGCMVILKQLQNMKAISLG